MDNTRNSDFITLTPQQIHERTGVPMYIIKRDMFSNKLPNFRFSQKTRVATPAAVLAWLSKYDASGAAAAITPPAPRHRPMSRDVLDLQRRAERAIKRL